MPIDTGQGTGAAPGSYQVLGQHSTVIVRGDGTAVDAVTIAAQEKMFDVWFQVTVTRADWNEAAGIAAAGAGSTGATGAATQIIGQAAGLIQALGILAPVVAISYQQNTNARGLLVDQLLVTVTDPAGESAVDVAVPLDPAQEAQSNNLVLATAAGIGKVAAAGG